MPSGDFAFAPSTIVSAVHSHGRWRGSMPAVTCGAAHLSWRELDDLSNRIGRRLVRSGVVRGDRIALLLGNRIETYPCYVGIWKALGVVVPLSTLSSEEALRGILADCAPRVLIVDSAHAGMAARAMPGALTDVIVWTLPDPGAPTGGSDWTDVLEASDAPLPALPLPGDDCTIVYTSGTTGEPKGVVHTHAARFNFGLSRSPMLRVGLGAVFLTSTPLYHNGAMTMLIPAAINCGHLCVMDRFDTEGFVDLLLRHKVQFTFIVPTQVTRLLTDERLRRSLVESSLEKLICAGAPLPDAEKALIVSMLGDRFAEIYGGTEGYGTIIHGSELRLRPRSVGRPMPWTDLRLIDDDGVEVTGDQIGEIVGRSAFLMRGYYGRPEQTQSSKWTDAQGVEYFRSGDLGRLDAEGYLSIVGRKKDMLISGGVNVYPRDIEQVLEAHPEVAEVAVVGLPDARWGELPGAAVVPAAGASRDVDSLLTWANDRLGRHQRIHSLIFVERLPRNVLGKVVKAQVAELFPSIQPASSITPVAR